MRKTLAIGAALTATICLTAAPANAVQVTTRDCNNVGTDGRICIDVASHRMHDGGTEIDQIVISVEGGFWETKAFDCDWLTIRNANDTIQWRRDGAPCDVYEHPGYTLFTPSFEMPNSPTARVTWAGWPKLDKEQDPGYSKVGVNIP